MMPVDLSLACPMPALPLDHSPAASSARSALRALAMFSPWLYATMAIAVQWQHPRFDWSEAPLSFYLSGPHGPWLQAAYLTLAAGIAAIALLCWRGSPSSRWQAAASLCLLLGSASLILTALFPGGSPEHMVSPFEHTLHRWVAQSAFGFTLLGMLLQGVRDRLLGRISTLLLGALMLIALVLGHWPELLPRGLGQRVAIASFLLALGWRAWQIPVQRKTMAGLDPV